MHPTIRLTQYALTTACKCGNCIQTVIELNFIFAQNNVSNVHHRNKLYKILIGSTVYRFIFSRYNKSSLSKR